MYQRLPAAAGGNAQTFLRSMVCSPQKSESLSVFSKARTRTSSLPSSQICSASFSSYFATSKMASAISGEVLRKLAHSPTW